MKLISICWILFVALSAVSADLIIAVPQPLTGQYEGDAKHITQAATLWANTVNSKGGLTIESNATRHNIVLQISKCQPNHDSYYPISTTYNHLIRRFLNDTRAIRYY